MPLDQNKIPTRLPRQVLWIISLAFSCLLLPFVAMEIGPMGIAFYGPEVPDIYIFGGMITGKDISFEFIAFAWRFQLIFIVWYAALALSAYFNRTHVVMVRTSLLAALSLLLLFPFWMMFYSSAVINNSDGAVADLTVYPHVGWIVYALLLYLNVKVLLSTRRWGGAYDRSK